MAPTMGTGNAAADLGAKKGMWALRETCWSHN
jgi:hypothetical protein